MVEAANILAQGRVDTTDETVYTVPNGYSAIVTILVANATVTDVTGLQIYANGLVIDNAIMAPITLASGEFMKLGPIALGSGDTIGIGAVTGDDQATYTVEGIEFSG